MTREQKVAEARRLREQGLTPREIGERVGASQRTVGRWLNPDQAARDRAKSQAWKSAHREANRARDRGYYAAHPGTCAHCGGPTASGHDGGCRSCRSTGAARKAEEFTRLWNEGKTLREIAACFGWSRGHVAVALHTYRSKGYDLPYRYPVAQRRAERQAHRARAAA